jgi:TRAP-type uncharacterized transport system fused permease subunit
MLSAITPPVAAGSFLAAAIAGAPPMKTALESMKMGVVIYIVPFFFIFEPSLILQGPLLPSLFHFSTAIVGVYLLASGFEGYILKIGEINLPTRVITMGIGLLWAVPEWKTTLIGAVLTIPLLAFLWLRRREARELTATEKVSSP